MDSSLEVRAYSSLSPFPSQFHFHTYSHPPGTGGGWCSLNAGNWLSLWSPVYFPPLPLPPFRPHHPASLHEQLGNLQQNTAVMSLPRTELWPWPGLPCLAPPRPARPPLGYFVLERKALRAPRPETWERRLPPSLFAHLGTRFCPGGALPG